MTYSVSLTLQYNGKGQKEIQNLLPLPTKIVNQDTKVILIWHGLTAVDVNTYLGKCHSLGEKFDFHCVGWP